MYYLDKKIQSYTFEDVYRYGDVSVREKKLKDMRNFSFQSFLNMAVSTRYKPLTELEELCEEYAISCHDRGKSVDIHFEQGITEDEMNYVDNLEGPSEETLARLRQSSKEIWKGLASRY